MYAAEEIKVATYWEIIDDISRVAHSLNKNAMSFDEYIEDGGKYGCDVFGAEDGSFAAFCELAGIKRLPDRD